MLLYSIHFILYRRKRHWKRIGILDVHRRSLCLCWWASDSERKARHLMAGVSMEDDYSSYIKVAQLGFMLSEKVAQAYTIWRSWIGM